MNIDADDISDGSCRIRAGTVAKHVFHGSGTERVCVLEFGDGAVAFSQRGFDVFRVEGAPNVELR